MNSTSVLIHITDTHLGDAPDFRLWGQLAELSCLRVIEDARWRFPRVDQVVHTGDITHDAGPAGMARMARLLRLLEAPVAYTPGNHDLPEVVSGDPCSVDLPGWRLLLLNSRKPGAVEGRVTEPDLAWLDRTLSESVSPVVLALHHPPMPTGTPWLDRIGLENAEDLWRVIRRHARVHAILHGHAHMEQTVLTDGVLVLGTPSTTGQFRPMAPGFALDDQLPGYRWLRLVRDGRLETGVVRVQT